MCAIELVRTKNGKDREHERQEDEHIHQPLDRRAKHFNQGLHLRHRVDGAQRSQDSERSQGLKAWVAVVARQPVYDRDDDDEEIKPRPHVAHVGILVEAKPSWEYFKYALGQENDWKRHVNHRHVEVPHRDVAFAVQSVSVVCAGQHDGIGQNDQGDEVLKILPVHEPDYPLSEFPFPMENKQRS